MRQYPDWFNMPLDGDVAADSRYAKDHWSRPSLQRVLLEVNALRGHSILDVGCGSLGFLSAVDVSYQKRYAVDTYQPAVLNFKGASVEFYVGNLVLDPLPVPKCDVVVATEVLEHVRPDIRRAFARKILGLATRALFVTIPYEWKGCAEPIPHDGYNESNVMEWFWPIAPDVSEVIYGHLFMRFDRC